MQIARYGLRIKKSGLLLGFAICSDGGVFAWSYARPYHKFGPNDIEVVEARIYVSP